MVGQILSVDILENSLGEVEVSTRVYFDDFL